MNEEIRKRLGELSDHLDASESVEADDIKSAVQDFDADGDHAALRDRLRDGALRFESSHPELSAVVARVVDSLTAAGI